MTGAPPLTSAGAALNQLAHDTRLRLLSARLPQGAAAPPPPVQRRRLRHGA